MPKAKDALIELLKSGKPIAIDDKPANDHTEDNKSVIDTEKRLDFFENYKK